MDADVASRLETVRRRVPPVVGTAVVRLVAAGLAVGLLTACGSGSPDGADVPGQESPSTGAVGDVSSPASTPPTSGEAADAPQDTASPAEEDTSAPEQGAVDGPGFLGALVPSSDGSPGDSFGADVDTDGQLVVAGAPGRDGGRGAAVVLRRFQEGLQQVAVIEPPEGTPADTGFGHAVGIDGDVMAVTAPRGQPGRLYVYERRGEDWELVLDQAAPGDAPAGFGLDVAVDGATVVVGAPPDGAGATGRAYVYAPPQGAPWGPFGELRPPDDDADRRFGASVAVDASTIVVGAPSRVGGTGAAHVYDHAAGYRHATELLPEDQRPGAMFGASVAVSVVPDAARLAVLVGAPDHDEAGEQAGATYRYDRDEQGAWRQSAVMGTHAPSEVVAGARFGTAVAIDGPATSVVGAATAGDGAGFVEVGLPDALAVFDAPPQAGSVFGGSVAVADGFFAVGAPRAFGDAGGVYVLDEEAVRAADGG